MIKTSNIKDRSRLTAVWMMAVAHKTLKPLFSVRDVLLENRIDIAVSKFNSPTFHDSMKPMQLIVIGNELNLHLRRKGKVAYILSAGRVLRNLHTPHQQPQELNSFKIEIAQNIMNQVSSLMGNMDGLDKNSARDLNSLNTMLDRFANQVQELGYSNADTEQLQSFMMDLRVAVADANKAKPAVPIANPA